MYLLLLANLTHVASYSWGSAVLACFSCSVGLGNLLKPFPIIELLTSKDIVAGHDFPIAKRYIFIYKFTTNQLLCSIFTFFFNTR